MSTAREIKKIVCRHCYTVLDVDDNFCRQCGQVTENGPAATLGTRGCIGEAARPSTGDVRPGWSESPAVVLTSLFFLLGPLALPMLWRSRCFSTIWKVTLTVIVVVATVAMCWLIWYLAMELLRPLREFKLP